MKDINLGNLAEPTANKDAIHIAIAPVIANHKLNPGTHVGLLEDGKASATISFKEVKLIGIVDPFLSKPVQEGERFFICLYPRTITSLCHVWTHPAFDSVKQQQEDLNETKQQQAIEIIKSFASRTGYSYAELLIKGKEAIIEGGTNGGDDSTAEIFNENKQKFLGAICEILNLKMPSELDDIYFRCAC